MIIRGESTIIDYHAPFDQGLTSPDKEGRRSNLTNTVLLWEKVSNYKATTLLLKIVKRVLKREKTGWFVGVANIYVTNLMMHQHQVVRLVNNSEYQDSRTVLYWNICYFYLIEQEYCNTC